ncbi:hypothetical protein A6770_27965 [Nostoc minutum NIES-26]|uniref:Uncharacterized protein n=1 Tax=Nostoc minutum NIES-26 TaxID=1844469 RepID=A0A367QN27_9NOSO|nr:hypothetical protein A6770_27965 [Nostoc minutum NIES-26]
MFEKWLAVILGTCRSPLASLKKGGKLLKVPLFKGDLEGSKTFCYQQKDFSNILSVVSVNLKLAHVDKIALATSKS